ncbi:MAG: hypothetical protein C0597_02315, partial [Marinilabiliales bacterium]
TEIAKINKQLLELVNEYKLTYIDLWKEFKDENGKLNYDYSIDGLHLNAKGYSIWRDIINNYITE